MSIFYCIPSARSDGGTIPLWRSRGYGVACWRDPGAPAIEADLILTGEYSGYAVAVNTLVREVLGRYPETEWLVTGGDDVEPDLNHAPEEIARDCRDYFGALGIRAADKVHSRIAEGSLDAWKQASTYGVMQPTGDGHGIETICGSPWIGAEFCRRAYGGNGPFFDGYFHNFCDQEMQEVAKRLGVFWQRPDLTHKHNNWMWTTKQRPRFLDRAYSQREWADSQALFMNRRAAGFPGHAPLPVEVCA